jgi:uncharacterized protein
MARKNALIAVLCILLILSSFASYLIYQQQQHAIEVLSNKLIEKESLIQELTGAGKEKSIIPLEGEGISSANIVAVRSDTLLGVIGQVYVEVREGNGRVLADTHPFVEPDTQYSARKAVKVAEKFTNSDLSNMDIIISFDVNGTLIGGPSAGAAIAVATVAAIEGKNVSKDAVITGTIQEGGYIGQVGGVLEKAKAAEVNGMKLFLIPKGQEVYEERIKKKKIFGFTFVSVYSTPVDLKEYMKGKMEVEEVSTIDDAVAYMIL